MVEILYENGVGGKEKGLAPSKSLLIWMLENLEELNKNVDNFGAKDKEISFPDLIEENSQKF